MNNTGANASKAGIKDYRKNENHYALYSQPSSSSFILSRKIDDITAGLTPEFSRALYRIAEENAFTVGDYILTMRTEINLPDHYRIDLIRFLCTFSIFNKNKQFKAITREDIISFLDSFRKPETSDPLHKWIGTYYNYRIHLLRFFKWLYYPEIEPDKRPKPEVIVTPNSFTPDPSSAHPTRLTFSSAHIQGEHFPFVIGQTPPATPPWPTLMYSRCFGSCS